MTQVKSLPQRSGLHPSSLFCPVISTAGAFAAFLLGLAIGGTNGFLLAMGGGITSAVLVLGVLALIINQANFQIIADDKTLTILRWSFGHRRSVIPASEIRSVVIKRPFWGQLSGSAAGKLEISTSGGKIETLLLANGLKMKTAVERLAEVGNEKTDAAPSAAGNQG